MKKYKASQRKVDLYDLGDGLTLMNIIVNNDTGKIREIDTYIGEDIKGFSFVGHSEGLDTPGVIFNYAKYVKMIEANLESYLNAYYKKTT